MSATSEHLIGAVESVMVARGIPLADVDAFDAIQAGIVEGSIPLPVVESSPPRFVTFADGFGNWHAGIPRRFEVGAILAARRLILDELNARGNGSRLRAVKVQRTPLHDTPTHVFYGEVV